MSSRSEIVHLAVFAFCIFECFAESDFLKPNILLKGVEDIVEANSNYSVFCQGQKPLVWTTPVVQEKEFNSWTSFGTEEEQPSNPNFKYGLRLYITNMTYKFVGFYYCHYKDEDNEKAAMYLYVDDKDHLSVTGSSSSNSDTVSQVYVRQRDIALIPCRPTSPSVKVEFADEDNTIEDATFDKKTGFSLYVSDLSMQGIYTCHFSRDSEEFALYFYLLVESGNRKDFIAIPRIKDLKGGHTMMGGFINLTCELESDVTVDFTWDVPNKKINKQQMKNTTNESLTDKYKFSTLEISNVTSADEGVYTCHVFDHQNHTESSSVNVKVFEEGENELFIEEPNGSNYIQTYAGKDSVVWTVTVWGHPQPEYKWVTNQNTEILPDIEGSAGTNTKYSFWLNTNLNVSTFTIRNITINDFGTYKLIARNEYENKTLEFRLNVTDKPYVTIDFDKQFHKPGEAGKVYCTATGYPQPLIEWDFKPCLKKDCAYEERPGTLIQSKGLTLKSQTVITSNNLVSLVRCTATNFNGSDSETQEFVVSEFDNGFDITDFEDTVVLDRYDGSATFASGEIIRIVCGASRYKYGELTWLLGNEELRTDDRITIATSDTKYSRKVYLEIQNASSSDMGTYKCTPKSEGGSESKEIRVYVKDPVKPSISEPSLEEIEMNFPKDVEMSCESYGIPRPKITWYKDGEIFEARDSRIVIDEENQILQFNYTKEDDEAMYECKAENIKGVDSKQWSLRFKNRQRIPVWLYAVIVVLFFICVCAIIFVMIKIRKERKLRQILKEIGLENFEHGAIENINPDLGIDEQAELLPYDKVWEFPIEKLKLGKQLGSGAFGVVMKGEAKHIVEGEPVTVVAVKMVRKNADHTHIKALASELKIMVHLGRHLNVVNLLGACTKNVIKEELLVIVEYCRYGNLLNYLLRHRSEFVNQVDPHTKMVNYNIGQDILDRTYSVSSNRSHAHSPSLKYAALMFSNIGNSSNPQVPNNTTDNSTNSITEETMKSDMTTVTQVGEDGVILSNNSSQPAWRSNYTGDYKENGRPLSTKDLIAWSFQIARGMDYLVSRKVLHGDLAARNILLADDNVVKICDFGLAKSMYKSDIYVKRGNCPLPIKWMAIESLRDHVFSVQSDVWSFGVVLWEIFSLGRTPYSGIEAEKLHQKLLDGYRMDSPEYAPADVYKIMTECWAENPLTRPSFSKLSDRLGGILEDSTRQHYLELNDPYLAMNTKRIEDGKSDYLSMLSPPTFESLSSPLCVDEGYMSMKPSSIFSPRVTEGQIFDFNVNNRKHSNPEGANGHELLPMLRVLNESDCETPLQSPNSVSNPSYHLMSSTIPEKNAQQDAEIAKSKDNYVDMLQNKSMMKEKSNVDPIKIEPAYVNSYSRDWDSVGV